jgi:Ca-activated chloride channel family protein
MVEARTSFAEAPREARFATAVAGFGQILRGAVNVEDFSFDDVTEVARGARGEDAFGYRAEFLQLVRLAKSAQGLETLNN